MNHNTTFTNHAKGQTYIHEELGIAFIPIPKNASTLIRKNIFNHDLIGKRKNFITEPAIFNEYKTVTILREPIERFCSAYVEILRRSEILTTIDNPIFHNERDHIKKFHLFIEYFKNNGFFDCHLGKQSWFISDTNDNQIKIDEFWYMNEINSKLSSIISGYKDEMIWSKQTQRFIYTEILENNKALKNDIMSMYVDDIELYKINK